VTFPWALLGAAAEYHVAIRSLVALCRTQVCEWRPRDIDLWPLNVDLPTSKWHTCPVERAPVELLWVSVIRELGVGYVYDSTSIRRPFDCHLATCMRFDVERQSYGRRVWVESQLRPSPCISLTGQTDGQPDVMQSVVRPGFRNKPTSLIISCNNNKNKNKLCAWRHNMPPPLSSLVGAQAPRAPPSRCNVAVLSNAEYVPTLTAAAALRVKAAVSKGAWWPWPLTFWAWKWCPNHVCSRSHESRVLPLCQF